MSSKADICNQALSHLAISTEIQDFDNEKSKEAQACRRFYDVARQKVLRDFDWPFANTIEFLALLANPAGLNQPTIEWAYSYRYPANAVAIHRMLNGATRIDTQLSRAMYSIGRDSVGKIIYADLATPVQVQYTYNETDPERFPPDFVIALSFYLAFLIAARLTQGGDTGLQLRKDAYAWYVKSVDEAQANSANQEPSDLPPDAEMIRVRE